MKKRNKPVGLVIALVLFVSAAAGINAYQNGLFRPTGPQQEALSASRESTSTTKDIANDAKGKIAQLSKAAPPTPVSPEAPGKENQASMAMLAGRKGRPLMAIDKPGSMAVMKPKPNDSSTSSHWYDPEARKDNGQ